MFLQTIESAEDRDRAQFIFDFVEAKREGGAYFWLGERPKSPGPPWSSDPRGGIFPHVGGLHYAPMSLLVDKSGVLQGQGAWTRYGPNPSGHSDSHCQMPNCGWRPDGCKHDDGFSELATLLGQDHLGSASRFVLAEFDIELLWDVALRTALRINGRAAQIQYQAGRRGPDSEDDTTTLSASGEPPTDDPDDHYYRRKFGRRLSHLEKKAIEMRAVVVARQHFENELNYATEDVGDTHSYDIRATRDGQTIFVEVKGTITDGSAVTLTAKEVALHEAEYPNNAFALVRNIFLDNDVDPPVASGGELVKPEMPWQIDRARLTPTEYRYRTGY